MLTIAQVSTPEDVQEIQTLLREYTAWVFTPIPHSDQAPTFPARFRLPLPDRSMSGRSILAGRIAAALPVDRPARPCLEQAAPLDHQKRPEGERRQQHALPVPEAGCL